MVKLLIKIVLIAGLSYIAQMFFPWWSIAIVAFGVALVMSERRQKRNRRKQKNSFSFIAGFVALFLLWGGAAFLFNSQNESVLASHISEIIPLQGSAFLLVLVTGLIGAFVGGFSALTGGLLGVLIKPAK